MWNHSFQNSAADVFEININTIRAGTGDGFAQVVATVIYTFIEAEFIYNKPAFLLSTGNSDHTATPDFRNLS